ncbi:MAG: transcriptional regulator, LysR family, partial [Myxococcaceae bacterium]|nr:transcriptional regulator, LysR family [Myxococcaceae bacterium]
HRTPRAVTLTEEGARLHAEVTPLLERIDDAAAAAVGAKSAVGGRLRINVDAAFGHFVLAPHLGRFLAKYPDLSLEYIVRDRMIDLEAEGFDVAVRFGFPEPSSLNCRLLFETRVLTCASPAYLARHKVPRHPRDLEHDDHTHIQFRDPSTGKPYAWELQRGSTRVPVRVKGRLVVNETTTLIEACASGVGIAQLLESYAREAIARGRVVPILEGWSDERFPVYAYHRSGRLAPARIRAFLDFVVELARRR